ncbi:hypothetical protein Tco_1381002 [Tanacetum coccineum]
MLVLLWIRSRRHWRLFEPSISRRSSITTSGIGSSNSFCVVADLPVLELLVGFLPLEVSLLVDGFMEDSNSLVLLLFVFLPWFGPAEWSSSSSSSSSCYLLSFLTVSATPLSIAFSSSIKASMRAWYNS